MLQVELIKSLSHVGTGPVSMTAPEASTAERKAGIRMAAGATATLTGTGTGTSDTETVGTDCGTESLRQLVTLCRPCGKRCTWVCDVCVKCAGTTLC